MAIQCTLALMIQVMTSLTTKKKLHFFFKQIISWNKILPCFDFIPTPWNCSLLHIQYLYNSNASSKKNFLLGYPSTSRDARSLLPYQVLSCSLQSSKQKKVIRCASVCVKCVLLWICVCILEGSRNIKYQCTLGLHILCVLSALLVSAFKTLPSL